MPPLQLYLDHLDDDHICAIPSRVEKRRGNGRLPQNERTIFVHSYSSLRYATLA